MKVYVLEAWGDDPSDPDDRCDVRGVFGSLDAVRRAVPGSSYSKRAPGEWTDMNLGNHASFVTEYEVQE